MTRVKTQRGGNGLILRLVNVLQQKPPLKEAI